MGWARRRKSCGECGTTLTVQQWLGGTQIGYVCTPCAYLWDYMDYLPSIR